MRSALDVFDSDQLRRKIFVHYFSSMQPLKEEQPWNHRETVYYLSRKLNVDFRKLNEFILTNMKRGKDEYDNYRFPKGVVTIFWNGDCIEVEAKYIKQVSMKQNHSGFYESPITGLQIAVSDWRRAVILKNRGVGKFRKKTFKVEGLLLYPQTLSDFPYHKERPFKNSREILSYIEKQVEAMDSKRKELFTDLSH